MEEPPRSTVLHALVASRDMAVVMEDYDILDIAEDLIHQVLDAGPSWRRLSDVLATLLEESDRRIIAAGY